MRCTLIVMLLCTSSAAGQGLKAVHIDSLAKESPLSVRADTMGRLFVGGREALFVYEPNENGGYQPRKLLFRFPPDSNINDIEIRGNDLFVLTRSALYAIPDGVRKREMLQPRKLLWGVPRGDDRQGFRALVWGPEGDLYLAVGAEAWGYWTFFNGETKTPYSGAGGVLRVRPDGSNLKVVARGLHHVDGLVFDRYWNLFSCDSDMDQIGRLLHITPHAFFDNSPNWLQPMLDGKRTSRIASLGYYDDGLFPASNRHHLLSARGDELLRLSIEPRGASFHAMEYAMLPGKTVAVTVGRGGRLFAITVAGDLVMLTTKDDPPTHPFDAYDAAQATPAKLWQEFNDPSWQRRYRAHIEMMRRGGEFLTQPNKRLLNAKASDPALHHLIWLAAKSEQGSLHLLGLIDHPDPRVRVQVIRALTEYPDQLLEEPIFAKLLLDEDPQVQHAAMLAYRSPKVAWNRPTQQWIERGPACSTDSYLRQAATLLLAEKATRKQLEDLCGRFDPSMRLAGVSAVGYRLTLPGATKALGSHLPLTKWRDESAYVIEYADGKVDLREHGRLGTFATAAHWKADMLTVEQNLLFKLLRKLASDDDARVRAEADWFLRILAN